MFNVLVRFDDGVPPEAQGVALLEFEKKLRQLTGMDCRVFKQKMGDDSKLRVMMTPEQRNNL
jgi:hypothetical protein